MREFGEVQAAVSLLDSVCFKSKEIFLKKYFVQY